MNEHISHVTDASFDADVLKSATPVLVDYWAEWCGPCKMIGPALEEMRREAVPQRVRRDRRRDSGSGRRIGQDLPRALAR